MSERISNTDIADRLQTVRNLAERAGVATAEQTARWAVQTGSKLYGNTFRLYQVGADKIDPQRPEGDAFPYGSGHYNAANLPSFLGWTKREAFDALGVIADTLWAVVYSKGEATK